MSNTIAITAKSTVTVDAVVFTNASYTKTHTTDTTITPPHGHHTLQTVTTSEEALSVGDCDISNATGYNYVALIYNRHATQTVTVKIKVAAVPTYFPIATIYPGGCFGPVLMNKLDGSSLGGIYLIASGAGTDCEVVVGEIGTPT